MNKNNLLYLSLFIPLILSASLITILLAKNNSLYLLLLLLFIIISSFLLRKFSYIPMKLRKYELGEEIDILRLGITDKHIKVYQSKTLDKIDFMIRSKDVVWNLFDKNTYIIISQAFIEKNKKSTVDMIIRSEVERVHKNYYLKSMMILILPTLIVVNLVLLSILINVGLLHRINPNLRMWLAPTFLAAAIIGNVRWFNQYASRVEEKLDNKLLSMYSYSEVIDYIESTEKYIGGGKANKASVYEGVIRLRKKNLEMGENECKP